MKTGIWSQYSKAASQSSFTYQDWSDTNLEDVPEITDGEEDPEGMDETPNVVEEHAGSANPEGDLHVSWTD